MIEKLSTMLTAVERNGQPSGLAANRKLKGEPGADFAAELLGAGVAGQLQAPAVQAQAVTLPQAQGSGEENPGKPALKATEAARSVLTGGETLSAKTPLSEKSSASMKTAAAIAGLKPWNKDWVFEGADQNPDLKPLIPEAGTAKPQLLENLAAQIVKEERARGEAENVLVKQAEGTQVPAGAPRAEGAVPVTNGTVALDELVSRQLRELDGEVTGQRLEAEGGARLLENVTSGKNPARAMASTGISGTEFLSALDAVRNGQKSGQQQADTGSGGGESSGRLAPDLKAAEGGLKGRKGLKDELFASRLGQVAGTAEPIHAGTAKPVEAMMTAGAQKPAEVTGHVVSGAMAADRLSTESLTGLSTGIRNLSSQGGGEIRVRLNPNNLGELHLRVVTQGNQVGLTIQASDDKAKKIIEESLSHLKDSLASHRLSLGQVDVTTIPGTQHAFQGESRDSQGQSQSQQSFANPGSYQDQSRSGGGWNENGGSGRWNDAGGDDRIRPQAGLRSGGGTMAAAARRAEPNGRLDVRA
ncbi:MAG: flagellar hook-length control protein FliK [Oligoflexia bacterium]|nr:flagellar hook-length control protein FliK [Oligoflexia bacterium]